MIEEIEEDKRQEPRKAVVKTPARLARHVTFSPDQTKAKEESRVAKMAYQKSLKGTDIRKNPEEFKKRFMVLYNEASSVFSLSDFDPEFRPFMKDLFFMIILAAFNVCFMSHEVFPELVEFILKCTLRSFTKFYHLWKEHKMRENKKLDFNIQEIQRHLKEVGGLRNTDFITTDYVWRIVASVVLYIVFNKNAFEEESLCLDVVFADVLDLFNSEKLMPTIELMKINEGDPEPLLYIAEPQRGTTTKESFFTRVEFLPSLPEVEDPTYEFALGMQGYIFDAFYPFIHEICSMESKEYDIHTEYKEKETEDIMWQPPKIVNPSVSFSKRQGIIRKGQQYLLPPLSKPWKEYSSIEQDDIRLKFLRAQNSVLYWAYMTAWPHVLDYCGTISEDDMDFFESKFADRAYFTVSVIEEPPEDIQMAINDARGLFYGFPDYAAFVGGAAWRFYRLYMKKHFKYYRENGIKQLQLENLAVASFIEAARLMFKHVYNLKQRKQIKKVTEIFDTDEQYESLQCLFKNQSAYLDPDGENLDMFTNIDMKAVETFEKVFNHDPYIQIANGYIDYLHQQKITDSTLNRYSQYTTLEELREHIHKNLLKQSSQDTGSIPNLGTGYDDYFDVYDFTGTRYDHPEEKEEEEEDYDSD